MLKIFNSSCFYEQHIDLCMNIKQFHVIKKKLYFKLLMSKFEQLMISIEDNITLIILIYQLKLVNV